MKLNSFTSFFAFAQKYEILLEQMKKYQTLLKKQPSRFCPVGVVVRWSSYTTYL